MKLLLILCIEEHEKEVRKLLRSQKVPMYSEVDVQGFKNENGNTDVSNWFAHDEVKRFSKLFFCIQWCFYADLCFFTLIRDVLR